MTDGDHYEEARDLAFKRDDHTCQLCGSVGYPKNERGLAAVPVKPNDYHVESLVTVCHDCLKKDEQQIKEEVAAVLERRQRRNHDRHSKPTYSSFTGESRSNSHRATPERIRGAIGQVSHRLLSLVSAQEIEEQDSNQLIHQVARRDNFNCQVCGAVVIPHGRVGYIMNPVEQGQPAKDKLENNVIVCWDCVEWKDDRIINRNVRQAGRLKNAQKGLSSRYAKSLLRELIEKTRLFVHTGPLVGLRRAAVATVGIAVLLLIGVLIAGMIGTLFVSPQAGIGWSQSAFSLYQTAKAVLLAHPWIALIGIAVGYLAHIFEQERAYERQAFRQQRRYDNPPEISYARPRWQFVASFAMVGLFGALDWVFVRHNVFPSGMLFGALVLWLVGAAGVAYYLRYALREDRDVDGQPVNPAPWVFAARYALFVALVGGAATLLDTDAILPSITLDFATITAPLVGLLYVLRRYAERRTSWGARLMQHVRTGIDRVWPWDDQWPPEPQHRQQTTATDSTSQRRNHDDSYE